MALIKYITDVEIAFGAIEKLPEACRASGMTKPLIVTDAGVKAAGILATAIQAMGDMPHAIYDGTPSNPTEAAVREATVIYKQSGCDGLIALGGGSSMDCAKGAAITVSHEGPLKTYATIEGGSPKITAKVAPLIAVPTTAGTGSEVARGAIVIVDDGRKLGFHSWSLVPKMAICDPALTVGCRPASRRHRHGCHRTLHGNIHGRPIQPASRWNCTGRFDTGMGKHSNRNGGR